MNEPSRWANAVSKATWTLLVAAAAVFIAWQLFQRVWPVLLIVAALIGVYRMVLSGRRRGGW
jgi:hypothetical protein